MKLSNSTVIENRKAYYDYFVDETIECGIELKGNEVKSIRSGKASIKEAWVDNCCGQLLIKQMHITPWETSNKFDVDSDREIKVLAHKHEIARLCRLVKVDGFTLIPLKIYFNQRSKCKVLIGLCRGKKNYDKRAVIKERNARREIKKY